MFTAISTYDNTELPTKTTPVLKTACSVAVVVSIVTAGNAVMSEPINMDIVSPASVSSNYSHNIGYNGNITLSWEDISYMSARLSDSIRSLNEIEDLPANWNGNGAPAFSKEIIAKAKELIKSLSVQPTILPTGRESIQMEYEKQNGDYLEFELYENGRLKMVSYTSEGFSESKDILLNVANEVVCKFYE